MGYLTSQAPNSPFSLPLMDALSVIIITYNESPHVATCLQSVSWADEIIVVDCGSKDGTLEICRTFSDKIYEEPRQGSGVQKQHALDMASSPWILNIDADERVSDKLKGDIQQIQQMGTAYNGFNIPRHNYFLSKLIKHGGWGEDKPLRFFRRNKTKVTETQVHEGFIVQGTVGNLSSPLMHDAYASLYQYFEKLNEYTSIEVRNRLRANPNRHINGVHLLLAPIGTFWKLYILKKGFLDGMHGLLLCILSSISVMVGYGKTWEYQMRHKQGDNLFPPIRTEEVVTRQPGYNRLVKGGDHEFNWLD